MHRNKSDARRPAWVAGASALAIAVSMMAVTGASAQVSTSTLRGAVTDAGAAEAGATIVAREVNTGFTYRGTANATGAYVVSGLRPGTYELTVTTTDGQSATDTVNVGVGQVGYVDLDVSTTTDVAAVPGSDEATELDEIVVVGRRLAEVRTPEIATNVTTQQIETLPQINRNFLNFAALAPGVRVSVNEQEQTITAGGQRAESVNAFIDGGSLKSNIIDGGIAGQDDSRGNPFPQAAIGEFRVITQNFKAEYEQASSAIITAVTRSGTNEFEGEIFGTYRDESFIEQDVFGERNNAEKPDLRVLQYGAAFGGPIIRDRLHFFGTYERKEENRNAAVTLGRQDPRFLDQFSEFIGNFAAPFEEDLYFGKLSWQPAEGHLVDLSVTWRDEFDTRGINATNAAERAFQLNQTTLTTNLRYQVQGDGWLNEFAVNYREYNYNQEPSASEGIGETFRIFENDTNTTTPEFDFDPLGGATIINTGAAFDRQDIYDEVLTFKNDLTFTDIEAAGYHTIKIGAKYSMQNYRVDKDFGRNPLLYYDVDGRPEISGDPNVPYRIEITREFPNADLDNNVIGLYIQDDWQITDQLELNLGLRWDYEDNANNNDYVTPDSIRNAIRQLAFIPDFFSEEKYFADGDREAFKDAWQPRVGFSYDVFGDRSTVIFGGAGRYYDRVQFNFSFDEITKPFQFAQNLFFSTTGDANGAGTAADPILWNESFRDRDTILGLFEDAPLEGEIFLLQNDFTPPFTDQFNIGVRQRIGEWQTEATLAYGKTENEFAWYLLNRCQEPSGSESDRQGGFCAPPPGFRNTFVSNHDREREWKALYLKANKPYTQDSGWGLEIAYTLSESEQNGSKDSFAFDYYWIDFTPTYATGNDERHRIVANGIVDLPLDFQLSGILTLGSGTPYDVFDSTGQNFVYRPNEAYPKKYAFLLPDAWAYRNLDLRLTKNFEVWNGGEVSVFVDAINVLGFDNFTSYDGSTGSAAAPNPRFGMPNAVLFPTRQFQIGARYRF